jgi:hypothetical protein
MIAAFLQAEVGSPRFGGQIARLLTRDRQDRRILDTPDLACTDENAYRARLLGEWRGYGRSADVFTDLPDDTRWFRARLDRADLDRVKYIDDDYWIGFSGGSRLVKDAIARIHSGEIDPGEAACCRVFAEALAQGARFPELILLHNPRTDELVVLEGHIRITSYLLWLGSRPTELPVILGASERMQK